MPSLCGFVMTPATPSITRIIFVFLTTIPAASSFQKSVYISCVLILIETISLAKHKQRCRCSFHFLGRFFNSAPPGLARTTNYFYYSANTALPVLGAWLLLSDLYQALAAYTRIQRVLRAVSTGPSMSPIALFFNFVPFLVQLLSLRCL